MWREGLGAYSIIVNGKKGYRNHPAVKEFEGCPNLLAERLQAVRGEMIRRGYHPKEGPEVDGGRVEEERRRYREWQSLEEQVERLREKGCECEV